MTTRGTVYERIGRRIAGVMRVAGALDTEESDVLGAILPLALHDARERADALAAERAKRGGVRDPQGHDDAMCAINAGIVREVCDALDSPGGFVVNAARRVVRERDEALKERDAAREAAAQLTAERDALKASPSAELVRAAEAVRAWVHKNASPTYFGERVREAMEGACWSGVSSKIVYDLIVAACAATPAPEAFDAATLKVGDRVRLREATVRCATMADPRYVRVAIDCDDGSDPAVLRSAIAAKVSP